MSLFKNLQTLDESSIERNLEVQRC